jgi:hypothetical protein
LRTKFVFALMLVAIGIAVVTLFVKKTVQTAVSETNESDSTAASPRMPVLVELFTSEGCSSCPPADALLTRLDKDQPVPGAEVIALSEHVDYWNRLGWSDPYSLSDFSERQSQYSNVLNIDDVYTPQMIIDGRVQFVGSNDAEARRAIADAARNAKTGVTVSLASENAQGRTVTLAIRVDSLSTLVKSGDADVMLAITESGLRSNVTRGENAGRILNHIAVVRRLSSIGTIHSQKDLAFTAEPVVQMGKTWKRENLKAVAFIQERASRRVLGVSALPLANLQ